MVGHVLDELGSLDSFLARTVHHDGPAPRRVRDSGFDGLGWPDVRIAEP